MKKILVTTDFSASSKSALYFAIQLAFQADYSLTFFHSYHVLAPTSLSMKVFESYKKSETVKVSQKLQLMVERAYTKLGIKSSEYDCVVSDSLAPEKNIMEYAAGHHFDFICISRRGESAHKSIFGSVTAGLINKSNVPVIAVPPNYRPAKITKALYASDLANLDKEANMVIDFAASLKLKMELLHFKMPSDIDLDTKMVEKASKKFLGRRIQLDLREFDFSESMIKNLDKAISSSKPSILIMFTEQHRNFFSRLFLPGVTPSYAFKAKVPILIFPKQP